MIKLLEEVERLTTSPEDSYENIVHTLQNFFSKHSCLTVEFNPIIQNLFLFNEKELKQIIVDYSAFSNEAIHMLLDAKIRNHDWSKLREEIQHNIEEEMGLKTKSVPHLEIMRMGYREDLNIETDFRNISLPTKHFLARMRRIFKHDNNAYSAGALLAFEGTAIPEFHILDRIVEKYLFFQGKTLDRGHTKNYIDGHKLFEIGHEQGLIDACAPYINASNQKDFICGYCAVVLTMHNWWKQLFFDRYSTKLTFVKHANLEEEQNAN